jgi:diguanylate cyclase (GGDEF)-like protein
LQEVVNNIQNSIRTDIDWLARYGGEEFLLVMPLTDQKGALVIAERLRKVIEAIPFEFSDEKVNITASFGLTSIEDWPRYSAITHEDLLHSADIYLYRAKEEGRNRVISGFPGYNVSADVATNSEMLLNLS